MYPAELVLSSLPVTHLVDFKNLLSDMLKEAPCLQTMWSFWLVAALHWWVFLPTQYYTTPCKCHLKSKPNTFLSQWLWTTDHFTPDNHNIAPYKGILQQTAKVMFDFLLFQSIYIQNKSEELNQEQRDLKKKNTGKRKIRDTDEDSREWPQESHWPNI